MNEVGGGVIADECEAEGVLEPLANLKAPSVPPAFSVKPKAHGTATEIVSLDPAPAVSKLPELGAAAGEPLSLPNHTKVA